MAILTIDAVGLTDEEKQLKAAGLVDVDYWNITSGTPLYTTDAGPCLIIVAHNIAESCGGLAHVFNHGAMSGSLEKLSYKASLALNSIVKNIGKHKEQEKTGYKIA